jgi:hypothetical protein
MDFHDMLENLSYSLNSAGFDIAHIGDVQELSSALDTLGIDVSRLGDYQMDLLLDALHHSGMTVAHPGAPAVDTLAGEHHQDISVASKTSPDGIIAAVASGATAGLKDSAEKAVKDAYDGLITFFKGRYQKHENVRKI